MNSIKKLSHQVTMYQEEICRRNYINLKKYTFGGMVLTGIIALVALLFRSHVYFTAEYCACFLTFSLGFLFTRFILIKNKKRTMAAFYIISLPIYAVGILMGSFLDPESNAITIMVLLCALTMFITDKPQKIIGYLILIAAAFAVCSYMSKPMGLFVGDLVNLLIYTSVSLGVNMLTLSDRIQSAETYTITQDRADKDLLTDLWNRGAGERTLIKLLEDKKVGSFIMIDIDNFKYFNDTYGHNIGDEVICAVSQQLKKNFRDSDVVLRLGGDEFAVFAVGLVDQTICEAHMLQIQDSLHSVATSSGRSLDIKISMGCTIFENAAYTFDQLYRLSDDALYTAKKDGKNCFVVHKMTGQ